MPHAREVEFCQRCNKYLLDTNGMEHAMDEHPDEYTCKDDLVLWVEKWIAVTTVGIQDT